jgi:hypothetical protein
MRIHDIEIGSPGNRCRWSATVTWEALEHPAGLLEFDLPLEAGSIADPRAEAFPPRSGAR